MDTKRTNPVPAGVFQAIGLALCFTCLWGIMNRFGAFPARTVSISNEYGETITFTTGYMGGIIDIILAIFWAALGCRCFSRRNMMAGAGSAMRFVACCLSIAVWLRYASVHPGGDFYEAKQVLDFGMAMGPVSMVLIITGIILIAIKGDIPVALKAAFILYPVLEPVALNLFMGHSWYLWFETVYAIGLTAWAFSVKPSAASHH